MTAEQRLTDVENDLETVKTLLMSAASYAESANRGLSRLTERFDGLTVKVDQLFEAQTQTQAQLDRLGARVDQLTAASAQTQTQLGQLFEASSQTQAQLTQLVASQGQAFARLERIERALDTLVSNQAAEREARLVLREDLEILYQTVQQSGASSSRAVSQLTEQVNQLTQDLTASVQDLVGMLSQLASDATQDRAEIRRIWQYLLSQRNGNQPS